MTKAALPKTATTAKTPVPRMTPRQWAEAEALWEAGDTTYEELNKKFGAAISTFERHFKKHGVVKSIKAAETKTKVAAALATATIDNAMVTAARIQETKEQHYTITSNLVKLVWNEVLEAKRAGVPVATRAGNIKTLKDALTAVSIGRLEKWAVLGLDRPDAVDPDELPELVISELTAEQIQELRDRDHSELDDIKPTATPSNDDDEGSDDDLVEEGS